MPKYGSFHSLAEFIGKTIPRPAGEAPFAHVVIDGLKRLSAAQEQNPWVTLSVSAGGGIWVTYKGWRRFMILPGQKAIRVLCGKPGGDVAKTLDRAATAGHVQDMSEKVDYRQWKLDRSALEILWAYVEGLPQATSALSPSDPSHPRNFPALARQAALEAFERSGAVCPGIEGLTSKHKVDLSGEARIEFDHILPYARGGSSSVINVQVLCVACNRLKRASAL